MPQTNRLKGSRHASAAMRIPYDKTIITKQKKDNLHVRSDVGVGGMV